MRTTKSPQRALVLLLGIALLTACAHSPATAGRRQPTPPRPTTPGMRALNIQFMLRGYFYAFAKKSKGIGGYARSNNYPTPIRRPPSTRGLFVTVQTQTTKRFAGKYEAILVTVGNNSGQMLDFRAQDSRLSIVQEARDRDGSWRPIEYLPRSWCGNSYHQLGLPAGYEWSFIAPRYHGSFRTQLRIKVLGPHGELVSQPFWGSINRAQFTVRRAYHPRNIMDPYNN